MSFERAKHLRQTASRPNLSFWYQDNMDSFTGLAGVGLLLTPTCPVRDLHDVTLHYASSPNLLSLYLLVRGRVDSVSSYIHVVYATVQPGLRSSFFSTLPRHFEDDSHVFVGNSNTVFSFSSTRPALSITLADKSVTKYRTGCRPSFGRFLAPQHPDIQISTSPTRYSRIDYVLGDK